MSIKYEVLEHKRDGHSFVQITGYEGRVEKLIIPETIDGLKVEAIGNHAFSGRDDISQVVLPESIKTLYGFAFHNCRNLKKISLFDSLDDYYDGVCRQCDSLSEVEITVKKSWYEVIRNFLADNDKTLRFLIHVIDGADKKDIGASCLTFPEYVYDFNENTMARTIQFSIAGSGYAFRECVDRRKIDYRQYDSLFEKALVDGLEIAQDIAVGRLIYPLELEDKYRLIYEGYIRANAGALLKRLIQMYADGVENERCEMIIKKLLEYRTDSAKDMLSEVNGEDKKLLSADVIDEAIRLSTDLSTSLLTALLMDLGGK
ncbi:MAG: leucine-rich repeat protein, partial [Butyrivibrio sp.]|nr:leucine-rich repeat protein [Butyrivibrio sp.]